MISSTPEAPTPGRVAEVALGAPRAGLGPDMRPWTASFHYRLPEALAARARPGQPVWVPFGRRELAGLILGLGDTSPVQALREVIAIIDERPLLGARDIDLARWLAAWTLSPLFDCLKLFLPPGGLPEVHQVYARTGLRPDAEGLRGLPPAATRLLGLLQAKGQLDLEALREAGVRAPQQAAAPLLRLGLAKLELRMTPTRFPPRTDVLMERLLADDADVDRALAGLRAQPRADVLAFLRRGAHLLPTEAQTLADTGARRADLLALAREGLVALSAEEAHLELGLPPPEALAEAERRSRRAPAQAALLRLLADADRPLEAGAALAASGANLASRRALVAEGLLRELTRPSAVTLASPRSALLEAERRLRRTRGHVLALARLATEGRVEQRTLLRLPQVTPAVLDELCDSGLARRAEATAWRDPLAGQPSGPDTPPTLTPEQAAAWSGLSALIDACLAAAPGAGHAPRPALLRGVTGSGKTELYLRAIERVVASGRQAIVLVPEIALTPQSLRRFAGRFPGRVGVWHSQLSGGERADTWRRAREGLLDVIVGSRSAVMAPLPRLGLIVVDECHAPAYKQGQSPRYHAVDVARERAERHGAALILGSATPTVEQTWEAEAGRMASIVLRQRVPAALHEDAPVAMPTGLPPVRIVDMRAELKAGNTGLFSRDLAATLSAVLAAGEQAILFLNRRGTASYVFCRDCGEVQTCPRCQISLTWHEHAARLVCHHCNHRAMTPKMCPNCASGRIRHFGAGTERVEAATREAYPEARVVRWDADTTTRKGAHEAILSTFIAGEADILVGTQMVAKGLDLPRVTLVGIVSADTGLHFPDFRASEQSFQLLTQVAGRAGRGRAGGQVVMQTYQPEHPAILYAAAHDYAGFYRHELAFRRSLGYPPFSRLARLLLVSREGPKHTERAALKLAEQLRARILRLGLADTSLIGPAPAFFQHLGGQSRWQILLRGPDPHGVLAELPMGQGWRVDVDPVDLL